MRHTKIARKSLYLLVAGFLSHCDGLKQGRLPEQNGKWRKNGGGFSLKRFWS